MKRLGEHDFISSIVWKEYTKGIRKRSKLHTVTAHRMLRLVRQKNMYGWSDVIHIHKIILPCNCSTHTVTSMPHTGKRHHHTSKKPCPERMHCFCVTRCLIHEADLLLQHKFQKLISLYTQAEAKVSALTGKVQVA